MHSRQPHASWFVCKNDYIVFCSHTRQLRLVYVCVSVCHLPFKLISSVDSLHTYVYHLYNNLTAHMRYNWKGVFWMGDSISRTNAYRYCVHHFNYYRENRFCWVVFLLFRYSSRYISLWVLPCMFLEAHFTHSVAFRSSTLIHFLQ